MRGPTPRDWVHGRPSPACIFDRCALGAQRWTPRDVKRLLIILALIAAGCGLVSDGEVSGKVIDGWRVGQPFECGLGAERNPECDEFLPAAVAGFDRRDPGHLPITSVVLYGRGDSFGNTILGTCSGGCPILAVFELIDGSYSAIGVGTPGVATEPMKFDYGPELGQ